PSIGKRACVQVMVDTGMTRSGVTPDGLAAVVEKISAHASLRLMGLCTHFSCGEALDGAVTTQQLADFTSAADAASAHLKQRITRHAANSAALFLRPETHLDMVRPGISLYGVDPTL